VKAGTVSFDESAWPVVILNSPATFSDESPADIVAGFDRILARSDHFALIVDTRPVKALPNAAWRKTVADWANHPRTQRRTGRYSVGTVMIFTSPLARGLYTALSWIVHHTSPQHSSADIGEAVVWSCEQLANKGVPRSRALVDLQRSLGLLSERDGPGKAP
jgi:hypothetical protein